MRPPSSRGECSVKDKECIVCRGNHLTILHEVDLIQSAMSKIRLHKCEEPLLDSDPPIKHKQCEIVSSEQIESSIRHNIIVAESRTRKDRRSYLLIPHILVEGRHLALLILCSRGPRRGPRATPYLFFSSLDFWHL